mmetsp:Transcript_98108/g.219796  ORF Transcript_98108/g.219796 Transcript_98108/m.219796 type:complete len:289 (+) Transcript_98108:80-946(+)
MAHAAGALLAGTRGKHVAKRRVHCHVTSTMICSGVGRLQPAPWLTIDGRRGDCHRGRAARHETPHSRCHALRHGAEAPPEVVAVGAGALGACASRAWLGGAAPRRIRRGPDALWSRRHRVENATSAAGPAVAAAAAAATARGVRDVPPAGVAAARPAADLALVLRGLPAHTPAVLDAFGLEAVAAPFALRHRLAPQACAEDDVGHPARAAIAERVHHGRDVSVRNRTLQHLQTRNLVELQYVLLLASPSRGVLPTAVRTPAGRAPAAAALCRTPAGRAPAAGALHLRS